METISVIELVVSSLTRIKLGTIKQLGMEKHTKSNKSFKLTLVEITTLWIATRDMRIRGGGGLINKDRGLNPSKNSAPQKSKSLSFCKPKKVKS